MKISKKFNAEIKYLIYSSFFYILFITPVIIFGQIDLEEYYLSFFITKTFINNPEYFLNDYLDFIGLGTDFFSAFSFILHPANLFINYPKIFFIIFSGTNLLIQIIFFIKILKFLRLQNSILFLFLVVFSIPNFNYLIIDNWPSLSIVYSLMFPCIYYLFRFLYRPNAYDFYFFLFFNILQHLNGHHPQYAIYFCIYSIIILVNGKFNFIKQNYFWIGLTIYFLSISESLIWYFNFFNINYFYLLIVFLAIIIILNSLNYFKIKDFLNEKNFKKIRFLFFSTLFLSSIIIILFLYIYFPKEYLYKINFYFYSIPIFTFLSAFFLFLYEQLNLINFKHGAGIYFFGLELIVIFKIFFKKKLFLLDKHQNNFKKIILIYIILIFILMLPNHISQELLPFNLGIFVIRDFILIFSIIIFIKFYKKLISNKKYLIFILVFPLLIFFQNISQLYKYEFNNYLTSNNSESKLIKELEKMDNNNLSRILLSPKLENSRILSEENIYFGVDFLKYDLYPINTFCKKCKLNNLYNSALDKKGFGKFYGITKFKYDDINTKIFFSFFDIKYFLFLEEEKNLIDLSNLKILRVLPINLIINEKLVVSKIYIAESKYYKIPALIKPNIDENKIENCKVLKCLINENNFYLDEKVSIKRVQLNKYKLKNNSNNTVQFLFYLNDEYNRLKINSLNKHSKILNLLSLKIKPNEEIFLSYKKTNLIFFRVLSYLSLLIMLFFIFRIKNNSK